MRADVPTLTLSTPAEYGVTISIQADGFDSPPPYGHGQWTFAYRIELADDGAAIEGDDLRCGSVPRDSAPDLPDALRSLLAFMGSPAGAFPVGDVERLERFSEVTGILCEHMTGGGA